MHKATDHEELLAFLLGQLVKEKVQLNLLERGVEPERVAIPVAHLDTRVSSNVSTLFTHVHLAHSYSKFLQAKELEIYDVTSFLRSKLFLTNGYRYLSAEKTIEKVFTHIRPDEL